VSGPLLDRFEIQLEVPPVPLADLSKAAPGDTSAIVAARVAGARVNRNRGIEPAPVAPAQQLLRMAIRRLGLSARAHDAIVRVARTIAHLEGATSVQSRHIAEAVQYRCLDRPASPPGETGRA